MCTLQNQAAVPQPYDRRDMACGKRCAPTLHVAYYDALRLYDGVGWGSRSTLGRADGRFVLFTQFSTPKQLLYMVLWMGFDPFSEARILLAIIGTLNPWAGSLINHDSGCRH